MQKIFILEDQAKGLELIVNLINHVFGDSNKVNQNKIKIWHKCRLRDVTNEDLSECDIAFIDLSLPDGLSFDIIARCKDICPETPVIVTTLYSEDDMVFNALKAGADGYLLKSDGKTKLIKCLNRILEGEPPISPQIARKLMTQFSFHQAKSSEQTSKQGNSNQAQQNISAVNTTINVSQLSKRENEVLALIAQGFVTKEIARNLKLSLHTINDIVKSIYKKLNINSRAQATNFALRSSVS